MRMLRMLMASDGEEEDDEDDEDDDGGGRTEDRSDLQLRDAREEEEIWIK